MAEYNHYSMFNLSNVPQLTELVALTLGKLNNGMDYINISVEKRVKPQISTTSGSK